MPYKDMDKKRARDLRWYYEHPEQWKGRTHKQYEKNPAYFNDRVNARREMLRDLVQQQKVGRTCMQCGIEDPRVLDFHHLDKSSKEANVGQMASKNCSVKRILAEIAKCETLCANCHRILHWEERNGKDSLL